MTETQLLGVPRPLLTYNRHYIEMKMAQPRDVQPSIEEKCHAVARMKGPSIRPQNPGTGGRGEVPTRDPLMW